MQESSRDDLAAELQDLLRAIVHDQKLADEEARSERAAFNSAAEAARAEAKLAHDAKGEVELLRERARQDRTSIPAREVEIEQQFLALLAEPLELRTRIHEQEAAAQLAAEDERQARLDCEGLRLELEDLHARGGARLKSSRAAATKQW